MVPATRPANTAIHVPASRGTEPCTACTVTSTPCASSGNPVISVMGKPLYIASVRDNGWLAEARSAIWNNHEALLRSSLFPRPGRHRRRGAAGVVQLHAAAARLRGQRGAATGGIHRAP